MTANTMRERVTFRQYESIWGFIMISPWLLGFLIFTLGPMISSLYLSVTDWDALTPPKWVALDNYKRAILHDPLVRRSLKVTSIYAFGSVPLSLVLGLLLALLMNQDIRGLAVFRTIYYLPSVLSGVAVALMWRWIFNPDFGLANLLLSYVGIEGPKWLFSTTWVLPSFIIMSLWGVGGGIVINLAALQGIPTVLYEAAEIDGAGTWQRFWHVTIPGISPVLFFNLVMGIIGNMRVFTSAYVTTGGGPANASLFYVLYLFKNAFVWFKMGYASALAWILFTIIMALTLLVFKSSPYWVYYEAEVSDEER